MLSAFAGSGIGTTIGAAPSPEKQNFHALDDAIGYIVNKQINAACGESSLRTGRSARGDTVRRTDNELLRASNAGRPEASARAGRRRDPRRHHDRDSCAHRGAAAASVRQRRSRAVRLFRLRCGHEHGSRHRDGDREGIPGRPIRTFYLEGARSLLKRAPWWRRFNYAYVSRAFEAKLKSELGDETFGDRSLQSLLLLVVRNADTDSTWPLSNNPFAKYNDPASPGSNLLFPLWQLIRASTAAPTYFAPQELVVGGRPQKFVDGFVSVSDNPSFILYLMATLPEYRLTWPTGEDAMLLLSIGTGSLATAAADSRRRR